MGTPPSAGLVAGDASAYAGAVATACMWAGQATLTVNEAVHLYMMAADSVATETVEAYRSACATALDQLGSYASSSEIQHVMSRTDEGATVLADALRESGEPVFPENVSHQYLPWLTAEFFSEAFRAGGVVIFEGNGQWRVAYGCEVDPDGGIYLLRYFDPGSGNLGLSKWGGDDDVIAGGYIVG
ncbi:hypothetical protein [Streptomyces sp. NPDC057910]|uniref:hypothetical protein n=1 Tax=Streptomyces sp. NPDC057910 TaxID=3346278 RepID=UPI0036E30462